MNVLWLSPHGDGWGLAYKLRKAGHRVVLCDLAGTGNGRGLLPEISPTAWQDYVKRADVTVVDAQPDSRPTRRSWDPSDLSQDLQQHRRRGAIILGPTPTTELLENDLRYQRKVLRRVGALPEVAADHDTGAAAPGPLGVAAGLHADVRPGLRQIDGPEERSPDLGHDTGAIVGFPDRRVRVSLALQREGQLHLVARCPREGWAVALAAVPGPTGSVGVGSGEHEALRQFCERVGHKGVLAVETDPETKQITHVLTSFVYPAAFLEWARQLATAHGEDFGVGLAVALDRDHDSDHALEGFLDCPGAFGLQTHREHGGGQLLAHGDVPGAAIALGATRQAVQEKMEAHLRTLAGHGLRLRPGLTLEDILSRAHTALFASGLLDHVATPIDHESPALAHAASLPGG